jgi:DNA-directed RNA polymerase subunit delta
MSVTDLAYCILKNRGKAVPFKELIDEIMAVKAMGVENRGRLAAQIHTEINLDSRFLHQGNGEWGLRDWAPKAAKLVRIRPAGPGAPPARPRPELTREDFEDEEDQERYSYDRDEEDESLNDDGEEYDYENEDLYGEED